MQHILHETKLVSTHKYCTTRFARRFGTSDFKITKWWWPDFSRNST